MTSFQNNKLLKKKYARLDLCSQIQLLEQYISMEASVKIDILVIRKNDW